MPRPDLKAQNTGAALIAPGHRIRLAALAAGNPLSAPPRSLEDAHVLIRTRDQLHAALALVMLDGIAARLVIAPPDLKDEHLAEVIARAKIDTLVTDGEAIAGLRQVVVSTRLEPAVENARTRETEWVMFTSGTTGAPKMVAHSLQALTGAIAPGAEEGLCGARSTISAAMAVCRFCCAP